MDISFAFQLIVLILSVIIHEISHGYMAERLGDPTARLAGRLTLNPIKHIDLFGSVILPLFLLIAHYPVLFGYAKPVPYNPYNLKNPTKGGGLIALAGPMSNIIIALIFGLFIRILPLLEFLPATLATLLATQFIFIVTINVFLGLINLLPIPPIDGSKVLLLLLPVHARLQVEAFWARAWRLMSENVLVTTVAIFLLLPTIFPFIFVVIDPLAGLLFTLFTGLEF